MRKLELFLAILLFVTVPVTAQNLTITYKNEYLALSPFERGLAEFNGMRYCEVHLDSRRTLTSLIEVVCRGGEMTENELLRWREMPDIGTLRFYAQQLSADSVKMMILTDGGGNFQPRMVQIPNTQHFIFMETYDAEGGVVTSGVTAGDFSVSYPEDIAVPLIAYINGLNVTISMGEMTFSGIDYCGLRNKHIHPSRWFSEAGVDNYIYYVAKFR